MEIKRNVYSFLQNKPFLVKIILPVASVAPCSCTVAPCSSDIKRCQFLLSSDTLNVMCYTPELIHFKKKIFIKMIA